MPKRKTDRKDAKWLCRLLLQGSVRPSFMPDNTQRIIRDYCRNRLFYNNITSHLKKPEDHHKLRIKPKKHLLLREVRLLLTDLHITS
ncbi:hypothetical protein IDJ77_02395 [Mucilaginibacter sp. ZT4R22]|uniref:Transposase n=1 Tax=Mucilaginibacter pankratovii TaxID=2772110 RepID=A0ABR7WK00_9SPHI|nr:hypothetical protein [Mucilaginibacter pankratovii]